jgi:RNA polymerase-binding transcription factor DksA
MDLPTQMHLTTLRDLLAFRLKELRAEVAESGRDVDEMEEVAAALHRLDAGVYGDCLDCGKPVALQRLLVQPAAARCAACQATRARSAARDH